MLRHTFATNLLLAGEGIEMIADLLGHEDIETTRVYARIETTAREKAAMKVARNRMTEIA